MVVIEFHDFHTNSWYDFITSDSEDITFKQPMEWEQVYIVYKIFE